MSKKSWGNMEPTRPGEPRRFPNRRKSTKINCGGHEGREHIPIYALDQRRPSWYHAHEHSDQCHPVSHNIYERDRDESGKTIWRTVGVKISWRCYHIIICARCGKIIDHWPKCPTNPNEVQEQWPVKRKEWNI